MKKISVVLCTALLLSLCAFAVSAENTGPMDEFDDVFPRGDLNADGEVDTVDYMMLKRAILGTYSF